MDIKAQNGKTAIFRRMSGSPHAQLEDVAIDERDFDAAKLPALPRGLPQRVTTLDDAEVIARYPRMVRIESM